MTAMDTQAADRRASPLRPTRGDVAASGGAQRVCAENHTSRNFDVPPGFNDQDSCPSLYNWNVLFTSVISVSSVGAGIMSAGRDRNVSPTGSGSP